MQIDSESDVGMTAGIFVSKNNRFVYVAGEGKNNLYLFERQLENVEQSAEKE